MATSHGIFEFKYFLSRNPERPLSDVQLVHLLNDQGFGLVRRIVMQVSQPVARAQRGTAPRDHR